MLGKGHPRPLEAFTKLPDADQSPESGQLIPEKGDMWRNLGKRLPVAVEERLAVEPVPLRFLTPGLHGSGMVDLPLAFELYGLNRRKFFGLGFSKGREALEVEPVQLLALEADLDQSIDKAASFQHSLALRLGDVLGLVILFHFGVFLVCCFYLPNFTIRAIYALYSSI
jgi:hypothetical protein